MVPRGAAADRARWRTLAVAIVPDNAERMSECPMQPLQHDYGCLQNTGQVLCMETKVIKSLQVNWTRFIYIEHGFIHQLLSKMPMIK